MPNTALDTEDTTVNKKDTFPATKAASVRYALIYNTLCYLCLAGEAALGPGGQRAKLPEGRPAVT